MSDIEAARKWAAETYMTESDILLAAYSARDEPGMVRVPREPTAAMLKAGMDPFMAAHDPFFNKNEPCGPIYKAMLRAATVA